MFSVINSLSKPLLHVINYIYIYIYIHAYTYDAPPKHTMGSTIESLQPISKNDESVVEYFFAENLFL